MRVAISGIRPWTGGKRFGADGQAEYQQTPQGASNLREETESHAWTGRTALHIKRFAALFTPSANVGKNFPEQIDSHCQRGQLFLKTFMESICAPTGAKDPAYTITRRHEHSHAIAELMITSGQGHRYLTDLHR
jgi:hypothetical protein